ncbi:MAG: 3-isopropylmalate dehydratase small subunit [Proteobacteria bacterium]|jgi:3-isopropylmalate dehydratase, small subunit|nr:MAG: 3-isopropylmalate dehydratase small subunit [Pseudomonadota bacterium]
MEPFTILKSRAVAVLLDDIDTDMLFPAQFCKTLETTGLGKYLFARDRYPEYNPNAAEFPLNKPEHAGAGILIAGRNFGCGSSREHAVWALRDYGFRCVLAESFSDILYANCFKNGMLPVVLPRETIEALARVTETAPQTEFTVDLFEQTVAAGSLGPFPFSIEPHRRRMLLEGLDEVGLTLAQSEAIEAFEKRHFSEAPWLIPAR